MRLRSTRMLLVLLAPALLGGLAAIVLQSTAGSNPIYAISFQADLGTMILASGLLLSLGSLLGWALYRWSYRQRESQLEETRKQLQSGRRRFLRQLDHELKNPLTALRMELAYLAGDTPPEEYGRVFSDMSTQIDRLSRLVTDLRKLGQLEEQELQRVPVRLDDVLQEVLEAVEEHPNYAERTVRLTLLSHPLPLSPVSGDRGLLWLACFNLLDNALKFTQAGDEVEVRVFEIYPWLVVEVADNGHGIAEQDMAHLFEELYRGENARGMPGSGLGLTLVRTIATLHEGSIAVRSQLGQGSVFTLRLPVLP